MDNIKLIIEKYDSSPLGWSKWFSSKKELLEELNSVLPEIKNNNEKLYWLKNGLKEYPKCPVCGTEIKKWCGRNKGERMAKRQTKNKIDSRGGNKWI